MLAPVLAALLIGQAAGRGDLPALAARYVQLGLPVPPRKARLRYWTDVGCEWDDNQRSRANILAGFVGGPGAGTRVWLGTVYFDADHQTGGRLDVSWFLHNQKTGMPAAQNLRTVGFVSWAYWEDVNMATAIQLWLRGEKARARSLFSVPLAQSGQQQVVADLGRPGQLRCTAIGGLAAAHWLDRLSQPGPHLSEVRTGLATAGRLGEIDDSPILRRVVQGLAEPPLGSGAGGFGSDLTEISEWTDRPYTRAFQHPFGTPPFERAASRGLSIVPLLIRHLDDHRPTRMVSAYITPSPVFLGEVCLRLLSDLSGGKIMPPGTPAKFLAWLRSANSQGEKRYFETELGGAAPTDEIHIVAEAVLAAKYPASLVRLYRKRAGARPQRLTLAQLQYRSGRDWDPLRWHDMRLVASQGEPCDRLFAINCVQIKSMDEGNRLERRYLLEGTTEFKLSACPALLVTVIDRAGDGSGWQRIINLAKASEPFRKALSEDIQPGDRGYARLKPYISGAGAL